MDYFRDWQRNGQWIEKTIYAELDPLATWSDGVPITVDDYHLCSGCIDRRTSLPPGIPTSPTQYTNIPSDDHLILISTVSGGYRFKVLELRPTQTLIKVGPIT